MCGDVTGGVTAFQQRKLLRDYREKRVTKGRKVDKEVKE